MTAILEAPATPAARVLYRDLTTTQRDTWNLAQDKVHDAEQAGDIDRILTIWAMTATALGVALRPGGTLVDCGCEECDCDAIYDLDAGTETVATVGGIQTPLCPACSDEHPPAE